MDPTQRPASSLKAKVFRGVIHSFLTIGAMALSGYLGKNPQYGAFAPLILGPLGGFLRDRFPQYANAVPF